MRYQSNEEVDGWANSWGRQRRQTLGINPVGGKAAYEPNEMLGKLRSTLGTIQKDKAAAGGGSTFNQSFPEVYTGIVLKVHRVYSMMPGHMKVTMNLHYVWPSAPAITIEQKANELGVSKAQYWIQLGAVRSFLYGAIMAMDTMAVET